jgi:hypothetical protein
MRRSLSPHELKQSSKPMNRALVKQFAPTVPPGLEALFKDPPLVGDEKREDYENLSSAVVAAIQPRDAVASLLALDFTNLTWEIQRERNLKVKITKRAELEWIHKLLSPAGSSLLEIPHLPPTTKRLAELWSADGATRQDLNDQLAKQGLDASFVMMLASKQVALAIEEIDRRLDKYDHERHRAIQRSIGPAACRLGRCYRGAVHGSRGIR